MIFGNKNQIIFLSHLTTILTVECLLLQLSRTHLFGFVRLLFAFFSTEKMYLIYSNERERGKRSFTLLISMIYDPFSKWPIRSFFLNLSRLFNWWQMY